MRARPRVVVSIFDDFDNPHYGGGGPVVVRAVARTLAVDHDVLVVTGGRRLRRVERDGVAHLHLPVTALGPRLGQLVWALMLPVAVVLLRFDVWIESFTPPVSSNLVPWATRRPVIGLAQSLSGREMQRRYRTSLPLHVERVLLRAYRDIVVLNARDQEVVRSCAPTTRVHLVLNSVDAPPRPAVDAARGQYALFLGRIDMTQKGLDLLLDAYTEAAGLLPLVIAGGGRRHEERELTRRLHAMGSTVRWVGPVHGEAKEALIAGCAMLVVPSREESFCLAALEALARGRPVVHFDLPQLRWIPQEGGVTVPVFDVLRLRDAVALLSRDVELRSALGAGGAAFASSHLAEHTLAVYPELVRQALDIDSPPHSRSPERATDVQEAVAPEAVIDPRAVPGR